MRLFVVLYSLFLDCSSVQLSNQVKLIWVCSKRFQGKSCVDNFNEEQVWTRLWDLEKNSPTMTKCTVAVSRKLR